MKRESVNTLEDLAFACPDGTVGVVAGFTTMEFHPKTAEDRRFIYEYAGRLGCSVKALAGGGLLVSY